MSKSRKNIWNKIGFLVAELVVVFAGVYLAFLLNNYRIENQNQQQRQKIYQSLYQYFSILDFEEVKSSFYKRYYGTSFLKSYQTGEMPRLKKPRRVLIMSLSDRNWISILQAGGYELLDPELIRKINLFYTNVERQKEMIEYFNDMVSEYLLPYYHADISRFYNLETKKLKPSYEWYIDYIKYTQLKFKALDKRVNQILKALRKQMNKN